MKYCAAILVPYSLLPITRIQIFIWLLTSERRASFPSFLLINLSAHCQFKQLLITAIFISNQSKTINFICQMICPYCQNQNLSLAQSYDISQVKQRFIPTYSHTQIFAPIDTNPTVKVRCTPTFYSTIFRGEPHCHKKKMTNSTYYKRPQTTQQTVYKNNSRAKKQDHFYGGHRNCNYNSKQLWYDGSKQELFKQQEGCCHRHYSKDRKQIDLSSNPVFGGTTFNFSHCKQESLNPIKQAQIGNKQEQKQVINLEKEQQQQRNEQHQDKEIEPEQNRAIEQKKEKKQESRQKLKKTVSKERKRICEIQANHPQKVQQPSVNKTTNVSKTIVEGTPCFTVIRKRNW